MKRPQKPFLVEVKRVRKGPSTKLFGLESPKREIDAPADIFKSDLFPEASPSPKVVPPRRILEAIEPPPVETPRDEPVDVATDEPVVVIPTRPRGRPRKSEVKVVVSRRAPQIEAPAQVEEFLPVPLPPRKRVNPVERSVVADAPELFEPTTRAAHGGRDEAASNLPRGERWKRRLPKVLW